MENKKKIMLWIHILFRFFVRARAPFGPKMREYVFFAQIENNIVYFKKIFVILLFLTAVNAQVLMQMDGLC